MTGQDNNRSVVVFPGTFDPITNGHLDVIGRGAKLFDELIVAVGVNPDKQTLLDTNERVEIIRQVVSSMPNVRVESFTGLTGDFAVKSGAKALLRGIRSTADLHSEFQLALTNRAVASIETIFIVTSPELGFISSSLIKQIAQLGGDVSTMVPPEVLCHIKNIQSQ